MPIYEYECQVCGYRHEALQKINDPLLTDCPECAKPALKKLISAAGFRLSGSGWYETDFKSDNKRNLATGDSKKEGSSKADQKESSKKEKSDKKATKTTSKQDKKTAKPTAKDK